MRQMDPKIKKHKEGIQTYSLSSKKNKMKNKRNYGLHDESPEIVVLDDSLNRRKLNCRKITQSASKICSPIVINDSSSDETLLDKFSKLKTLKCNVNVSINHSNIITTPESKSTRPSLDGWSSGLNIICAKRNFERTPSTPNNVTNESIRECSFKKIQQSQNKLLNELYGDVMKTIPILFKKNRQNRELVKDIAKKLNFEDDDSDKENKRSLKKELLESRKLYLTGSDLKKTTINYGSVERKCKKKLYTEKVPSTPEPRVLKKSVINTKTMKEKSVTELVEIMTKNISLNDKCKNVANDKNVTLEPAIDRNFTVTPAKDKNGVVSPASIKNQFVTPSREKNTVTSARDDDVFPGKGKKVATAKDRKVAVTPAKLINAVVTPARDKLATEKGYDTTSKVCAVKRLSFVGSLADNVPSWRCHFEALQYHDNYKTLKEQLTRRLFDEFNKNIFDNGIDVDLPVTWDSKLRTTAGTTLNRRIKTSNGVYLRKSSIKLSCKVVDTPQRLRDTLVHEMCHVATWLLDAELRAGHGPLWKRWATRSLQAYPELGEISRCHNLDIHFKYTYKCTKCGYSIKRHSKSIDISKKCCGYCGGIFEVILNRKNKDGAIVSTPARERNANEFSKYVKDNYGTLKDGTKTHAQVMKILGEQFSAKKKQL